VGAKRGPVYNESLLLNLIEKLAGNTKLILDRYIEIIEAEYNTTFGRLLQLSY